MTNLQDEEDDTGVIWEVGVFDAHCHPTDIMASVNDIASMKARVLTVMSTRSQDQALVEETATRYIVDKDIDFSTTTSSNLVIPAFGWHPWMSYQLVDDRGDVKEIDAVEHYKSVLVPAPEDVEFMRALPRPTSITKYLEETSARLDRFPLALVGEVGLDRAFRLPENPTTEVSCEAHQQQSSTPEEQYTAGAREGRPLSPYRVSLEHQKKILKAQLELAAKMRRPVSLHSVQAHGVVFEVLQSMWKGHEKPSKSERKKQKRENALLAEEDRDNTSDLSDFAKDSGLPYPPRICMHSYSGPPEALKQFLNPKVPTDMYFSFSTAINFSNVSAEKVTSVIKQIPDDRILIESDLHCAGELMDSLLHNIVVRVCEIKGWPLRAGAERLKQNWIKFVFG